MFDDSEASDINTKIQLRSEEKDSQIAAKQ